MEYIFGNMFCFVCVCVSFCHSTLSLFVISIVYLSYSCFSCTWWGCWSGWTVCEVKHVRVCVSPTCVCPMLDAAIKACCRALFFRAQSCCCPSPLHSSSSRYWIISGCPRRAAWTSAHWPLLSTWSTWWEYNKVSFTWDKCTVCWNSFWVMYCSNMKS